VDLSPLEFDVQAQAFEALLASVARVASSDVHVASRRHA
jgi:hypothetical protein